MSCLIIVSSSSVNTIYHSPWSALEVNGANATLCSPPASAVTDFPHLGEHFGKSPVCYSPARLHGMPCLHRKLRTGSPGAKPSDPGVSTHSANTRIA
ncbi:hypothetical protein ACQKWADRAFT_291880 [Trichoderma austrokoningii]